MCSLRDDGRRCFSDGGDRDLERMDKTFRLACTTAFGQFGCFCWFSRTRKKNGLAGSLGIYFLFVGQA